MQKEKEKMKSKKLNEDGEKGQVQSPNKVTTNLEEGVIRERSPGEVELKPVNNIESQ